MKEIQIRCVNQREINKIIDILFKYCYGESHPNAYKNELKESVTEFVFNGFIKEEKK